VTTLSYGVKLVTDGTVSFEYQAADPANLLQFKVSSAAALCRGGKLTSSRFYRMTIEIQGTFL